MLCKRDKGHRWKDKHEPFSERHTFDSLRPLKSIQHCSTIAPRQKVQQSPQRSQMAQGQQSAMVRRLDGKESPIKSPADKLKNLINPV